jgi:hypothetical protein
MSKSIVNVSVALSWGTLPLPQAGQPEWLSIPHHDPVRLLRRTRPFRDAFRRRQGQYHHSHRSIFVRRFIFELAGRIIRFIEDNWNLGAELEIVPSMHWLARCSKCSTLIMSPKRNAFFSIRTQASLAGSNLKLASRVGVYLRRKRLLIDFAEIVCIYR